MNWDELNDASEAAFESGNYLKALQMLNQAVPEAEKDPAQLAVTLFRLGRVCLHLEENERAEAVLTRALSISGKVLGLEHEDVARVIDQLGNAYANQNKFTEAEPLLKRGLEMRKKLLGEEQAEVAESLVSLGALYARQKNFGQGEMYLRQALEMQHRLLGEEHPAVAETLGLLALLFYNQNVFAESLRFAERSLVIRQNALGPEHPDVAMSLHIAAVCKVAEKDFDSALSLYDQVLRIRLMHYPPEHALVTSVMRSIGMVQIRSRHLAEAHLIFEDLERMTEASGKSEDLMFAMKQLGWLYVLQRQFDAGQVYITRALRRLQNSGKSAERARDNLTMALFCCHVGQKDYLAAATALPAAAKVMTRNRPADKVLFKRGFQAGITAGKRS
jgi:tetratricopeptide (TPR) repeat protein